MLQRVNYSGNPWQTIRMMSKFKKFCNFAFPNQGLQSGCSAVGSVPRSGRGGRKFESSHPDNLP